MIPKILHGTRIFQDLFGAGCTGTNLRTIKRRRTWAIAPTTGSGSQPDAGFLVLV
jgi:hypothetical protein